MPPVSTKPKPPRPWAFIDIETLNTPPHFDTIVDDIGAIIFSPTEGFPIIEELGLKLDIPEQLTLGRSFSADTIAFRRRTKTLPDNWTGILLEPAVDTLNSLLHTHDPELLWIWGKDFDGPILSHLFHQAHRKLPIPYYNTRCARDHFKTTFGDNRRPLPHPHQGLADCRAGITDLHTALGHLNRLPYVQDIPF